MSEARKLPFPPAGLLAQASLFLDFDGTLVEIAARPDAVTVEGRLRALIADLHAYLAGRVAIISGRAADNIRTLLDGLAITVAGSHGAELCWANGECRTMPTPPYDIEAGGLLRKLRARYPAILIERKPVGLALHFRQAPQAEAECREVAGQIAARSGLMAQPGKMVIELKAASADKGTALRLLLAHPPMKDGRPIFIGDDETDEAGFRAAADLGGAGIIVGEERTTAASYRLPNVDQTLDWLENSLRVRT